MASLQAFHRVLLRLPSSDIFQSLMMVKGRSHPANWSWWRVYSSRQIVPTAKYKLCKLRRFFTLLLPLNLFVNFSNPALNSSCTKRLIRNLKRVIMKDLSVENLVLTGLLPVQNTGHENQFVLSLFYMRKYYNVIHVPSLIYDVNNWTPTSWLFFNCCCNIDKMCADISKCLVRPRCGSRGGGPGGPGPPPDPRFWGPKIEHFWALFNFSLIFLASLRSAYYFFNMLLFQSSNSKIFQPRFARHMISHLEVFVFSLSFTHFRLLGVHLSLSFF